MRVVFRKPLPSFTSFMGSAKSHLLNFRFLIWKTNITKWDKVPNVLYPQSRLIAVVIIRIISGCIYYVRRLLGTLYFYIIQSSKSFEKIHYYSHFPDEEIEAWKQFSNWCSKHNWRNKWQDVNLGCLLPEPKFFCQCGLYIYHLFIYLLVNQPAL